MISPSTAERRLLRKLAEEKRDDKKLILLSPNNLLEYLDALEAAERALGEVMEDHAWKDELWRFTDETEAVLAALEVPDGLL